MDGEEVKSTAAPPEEQCRNSPPPSPEIVEIGEVNKSTAASTRDEEGASADVYIAVGKNDLHVVQWALDHAIRPGNRVFLVHVFSPLAYIATPVGMLSRSQLSKSQLQVYIREESNKRKHLLEKYINLCNDSKIIVDTMLVESSESTKAILDLISIANITNLVVGTKQSTLASEVYRFARVMDFNVKIPPFAHQFSSSEIILGNLRTGLSRKWLGKGEYIQKKAPEFCEVSVVYNEKKMKKKTLHMERQDGTAASTHKPQVTTQSQANFLECVCFPGKFS